VSGARRGLALCVASVLVVAAAGCGATETGNPSLRIDPRTLSGSVPEDDPSAPTVPTTILRGGPGTIDPPVGELWIWPLETAADPTRAPIATDGSFDVIVEARARTTLRVQARDGAARSEVLDARVIPEVGLVTLTPATPCLRIEPGPEGQLPDVGESTSLRVVNECSVTVLRAAARLRAPSAGLVAIDDAARELAPGESAEVRVRSEAEAAENIALFEITAPVAELRAVSLVR
jgi:hypothetical protein